MKKSAVVATSLMGVIVFFLFMFVISLNNQNDKLENDLQSQEQQSQQQIELLENELQQQQANASNNENEAENNEFHTSSEDAAKEFVRAYFDYTGSPNKQDVQEYATSALMEKLSFSNEEEGEVSGDVKSNVSDMEVYYGSSTEGTQELFITFTNTISYNDVPDEVDSFVTLKMDKENDSWKASNIKFDQI